MDRYALSATANSAPGTQAHKRAVRLTGRSATPLRTPQICARRHRPGACREAGYGCAMSAESQRQVAAFSSIDDVYGDAYCDRQTRWRSSQSRDHSSPGRIPVNREICREICVSGRLLRGRGAWRARRGEEIRSSGDEMSPIETGKLTGKEQGKEQEKRRLCVMTGLPYRVSAFELLTYCYGAMPRAIEFLEWRWDERAVEVVYSASVRVFRNATKACRSMPDRLIGRPLLNPR